MYGIPGFDDEEALQQYLMAQSEAPNEGFQAQQMQYPELAQLLGGGGGVTQQLEDMGENASDVAQATAALGQQMGATSTGAGRNHIDQLKQASQAAMQQDQQSKGGGLLGGLLKMGINMALGNAMGKWIGGMFPKKGA